MTASLDADGTSRAARERPQERLRRARRRGVAAPRRAHSDDPRERVREVMARLRDGRRSGSTSAWTSAGRLPRLRRIRVDDRRRVLERLRRAAERERPDAGDGERRFAVVYHLLSVALNQRLRVKASSTRPSRSSIR